MELTVQPKNISVTMSEVQVCLLMSVVSTVVEMTLFFYLVIENININRLKRYKTYS